MSNLLSNLNLGKWKVTSLAFFLLTASSCPAAQAAYGGQINTVEQQQVPQIAGVTRINPTTVEVLFSNQQRMTIDFYGENIFRMFQDNAGGILRDPAAKPEAKILVSQPRKGVSLLDVKDEAGMISIATASLLPGS